MTATSSTVTAREIHLARRPNGEPKPTDFTMVETTLDDPGAGQLLVRNLVMSVDPYMRGRMNDAPSYVPPWQLDSPCQGGAVGEVLASTVESLPPGALVVHDAGWRDYALISAKQARAIHPLPGFATSQYLGSLGMTGLTAYTGLFRIAKFQPGETVFVSGAAGAVGGLVGQLARLHGAKRVVGSAGSPEKVRFLTEALGYDAAFDYHDGSVSAQLRAAVPEGIDVYFDNVGGEHLEAAIGSLNPFGRAALCGAISMYNATEPAPGPRNMAFLVGKRLTLQGFIVSDHADLLPEFEASVGPALASGQIHAHETIVDGLDNAVPAFIGLLRGENTGKMVVRLAPDPA